MRSASALPDKGPLPALRATFPGLEGNTPLFSPLERWGQLRSDGKRGSFAAAGAV
jgi:hypothetical protein